MKTQKIKKIVIVGGGTAGWMAAASFSKILGNSIEVTLIESEEISTIGVGEATIPPLILLNRYLGINEQEFLRAVKGTFKLGISFENWRDVDKHYIHAFGSLGKDSWSASFQHFWRRGQDIGIKNSIGEYCLEHQAAIANKFAHLPEGGINYAYHIDAACYAKFLRKISEEAGTRRVEGKVVAVNNHPSTNYIESVCLASGELISGDFFIDCSGFRGLLIEQNLRTGYEDWSHWLPCDSAIAVQTESVGQPVPFTRSIARDAGWQWQIPLQHRTGNGLVYCSRYMSDDDAKKTLLSNIEGKTISEPRVIKYKTGQRLRYWNKNCVALGLASGFIEPLESTSIHLVQRGITRFIQMFPGNGIKQSDVDEYNEQMKREIVNVRDFIILHYHVTERDDTPFWRSCRNMDIPESLSRRINMFKDTGKVFIKANELFVEASWVQVMLGQGLTPNHYHPMTDQMSDKELAKLLHNLREPIRHAVNSMPSHNDYLNFYCKAESWH